MSEVTKNFTASPSLSRVGKGELCTGCGLCAGLAPSSIKMKVVEPGFNRPEQTGALTAAQEELISTTCPGLVQEVNKTDGQKDPLWGTYLSMRTGHASSSEVRFAGSSGGGLTQTLLHLLSSNTVDAVVHTSADPDFPIGNCTGISVAGHDVIQAAGSRYAPSSPLADLDKYIADGRRFAFVGKPCDAAALRALVLKDPKVAETFPVILSFFCAGVPSHTGGKAVLAALGTRLDFVSAFRFRGNGWPGDATATIRDGSTKSMSYHESWGKILSKHVQHRCKICADGTGVAADIVFADAWEADDRGYPIFDEADGESLIVCRTAQGQNLMDSAIADGAIIAAPFNVDKLAQIQPGQRERRRALFARLLALRIIGKPVPRFIGLDIARVARQNTFRKNLKNFLGTLRRSLKAKGA